MLTSHEKKILTIYDRLFEFYGPCHWWPGRTPWEVIVGAILTQNTAWANVEKAIANLRHARCLSISGMRKLGDKQLAQLIRPSGYFNQKVRKLRAFLGFLDKNYGGTLARMRRQRWPRLRNELLEVWGLGPETVDSILLYALEKPVFVVDAYTKRIFSRHRLFTGDWQYQQIQDYFIENLPRRRQLYNEYHALIVNCGKDFCRSSQPRCEICPLREDRKQEV